MDQTNPRIETAAQNIQPEIEYPLYDVSEFGWNEFSQKEHNIIFQNPYAGIVPYQKKKFVERMKKYEFVDCNGQVFKVTEVHFEKPGGVRGFFTLACTITLLFRATGRTIGLKEFKDLVLSRARQTGNSKLEEAASRANTIGEVLKPADSAV